MPATLSSAKTLLDNRPPNRIAPVRWNLGLLHCLATGKHTLLQRGLNATSKCFEHGFESNALKRSEPEDNPETPRAHGTEP